MINYKDLATEELICLCRDNDSPEAWNEFFRRYTGLIKRIIVKKIKFSGLIKYDIVEQGVYKPKDDDLVCDIFSEIYIKLRIQKKLENLRDLNRINAFLKSVTVNTTISWIRLHYADKNRPKVDAERNVIQIDAPVDENEELEIHEINDLGNMYNPGRLEEIRRINEKLNRLAEQMEGLSEKQLWIMRLKLIYYDPLTEKDIRELSRVTEKSVDELNEQLSALVESLLEKSAEKEKEISSASRVLAVLNHLESRLKVARDNPDITEKQIVELENKIQNKRKRMTELIKKGNQLIDSTEEEVANILGIKNKKNVSLDMYRARKKLKKTEIEN